MKRLFIFLAVLVIVIGAASAQNVESPSLTFTTIEPFEINGVTMGPLREIAEVFSMIICAEKDKVIIQDEEIVLVLTTNSDQALINHQPIKMPRKAILFGKTLVVPIRFLCDTFGWPISREKNQLIIDGVTWRISDSKRILIDLGRQRVFAFEGWNMVYTCRTCTGKKSTPTKSGIFKIYRKSAGWHEVRNVPWGGKMYNSLY